MLVRNWHLEGHDIGWAEAVAFELLARTLITLYSPDHHFRCHSDNTGVVEGWWKGASKNAQTNGIFQRMHNISETTGAHFHTQYVPSQHNPADAPSRGILGPPNCLLPTVSLPIPLLPFIQDAIVPSAWPQGHYPLLPKQHKQQRDGGQHVLHTRQLKATNEEALVAAAAAHDL
jgi:hypothetical protein